MKRLAILAAVCALVGCDAATFARFTHSASPPSPSVGGPGTGWQPLQPGQQFRVWVHDPQLDNGCNEWDTEPAAEVDNDGVLCLTNLP